MQRLLSLNPTIRYTVHTKYALLYQGHRYKSTVHHKAASNKYSNKISALPFQMQKSEALKVVKFISYVDRHPFFAAWKLLKCIFTKEFPVVKDSMSFIQLRKAYMPIWYYDMAVTAHITPFTTTEEHGTTVERKRQILGVLQNSFWSGTAWEPMCYLSFARHTLKDLSELVPFAPYLYIHENDIEIVPFTVDPLNSITDKVPTALENLKIHDENIQYTIQDADVIFNAAYPIYWPVYIAQFIGKKNPEKPPVTIVPGAHKCGAHYYRWYSTKGGLSQWYNNGPWIAGGVAEQDWQVSLVKKSSFRNHLNATINTKVIGSCNETRINWQDPRIQLYSSYEKQNKDNLDQLFKVWVEKNLLFHTEDKDQDQVVARVKKLIGEEPIKQFKTVRELRQDIMARRAGELKKLKSLIPTWFKKYIKQKNY